MKLAEPELSELDQSWTDEPERLVPRRAETRPPLPGLPPAPVIMQIPLPRPALPTPPSILPESTLTMPTRPVPRRRDHNDSTLIVRPRPATPKQIARRPWLIGGVASALVVIGTLTIALWPTARVESAPRAPVAAVAAAAPPASTPVARSAAHPGAHPAAKPAKRVATTPKKKPPAKKATKPAPKKTGAKPTTAPAKPTTAPAKPTTAAAKPTAKV